MTTRDRQDALIRHMRRNGTTTVATLAHQVGASRRTILRDIAALRDAGFVIDSEPGRGGGLALDTRSVQTTPRLTVPEVFALLISVASMRAAGNLPFANLADAGLAKIEKALPSDKLRDLRRLLDCLYIGTLAPQIDISNLGQMSPNLLSAFEHAFLKRLQMRFDYSDAKGARTSRRVEPHAMLILPPIWYLVAWDPMRNGFRHFRMDRIRAPEHVEGSSFLPRHVTFGADIRPVQHPQG
ncbi:MAG: WYL domain-containing protein [Rhodobacteraceae bacterium]|nr:WYL domain-containing protein [Paracoccaceae bacterium]